MRSVHLSALTVLALGALAPSAFAAQTFAFANPFGSGGASFANSQFQTVGIAPPAQPVVASIENLYAGTVNLGVIGGTTAGNYNATYTLVADDASTFFVGVGNPSGTATALLGGLLTFFSTGVTAFGPAGTALLTYDFDSGALFGSSGFGVSPGQVSVSGPLVDLTGGPINQAASKFSFSFPGAFVNGGFQRYTAGFTSSVEAVPEPASMGVLAIGAVALLRRRRRA